MYERMFTQILGGSLAKRYLVRHVFMDLLLICDRDGVVDMTPEVIAGRTGGPLDITISAIEELCAPDPQSRTPTAGGRRLVLLDPETRDWGWQIVNYAAFQKIRNEEGRKTYMRDLMRKRRAAAAEAPTPEPPKPQKPPKSQKPVPPKPASDDVMEIVNAYREFKRVDGSRSRAVGTWLPRLLKVHPKEALLLAVANKATEVELKGGEQEFVRGIGNFFGIEKDWEGYAAPDWKLETSGPICETKEYDPSKYE